MKTVFKHTSLDRWRRGALTIGACSALLWVTAVYGASSVASPESTNATNVTATEKTVPVVRDAKSEGPSKNAATTNAPGDFSAFKIIYERNIFNPNRRPKSGKNQIENIVKNPKIDSFSLVGTLTTPTNTVAFFSGSSSAYRTALPLNKSIAGYRVAEIDYSSVKLCDANHTFELPIGKQMRREDEGEWKMVEGVSSGGSRTTAQTSSRASIRAVSEDSETASADSAPSTDIDAPGDNPSDKETEAKPAGASSAEAILKRLMEKRQKE